MCCTEKDFKKMKTSQHVFKSRMQRIILGLSRGGVEWDLQTVAHSRVYLPIPCLDGAIWRINHSFSTILITNMVMQY
jgi:hypothetical protein